MPPATTASSDSFPSCRTMWQHLNDLKKENFSLKLRIYFLEEKIQQKFEESDGDGVHRTVSPRRRSLLLLLLLPLPFSSSSLFITSSTFSSSSISCSSFTSFSSFSFPPLPPPYSWSPPSTIRFFFYRCGNINTQI